MPDAKRFCFREIGFCMLLTLYKTASQQLLFFQSLTTNALLSGAQKTSTFLWYLRSVLLFLSPALLVISSSSGVATYNRSEPLFSEATKLWTTYSLSGEGSCWRLLEKLSAFLATAALLQNATIKRVGKTHNRILELSVCNFRPAPKGLDLILA